MKIVNITATFRLSGPIDLIRMIEEESPFASPNRGFSAVSLRLFTVTDLAVTALIFSSGSVVLVGGKSVAQLAEARELMMTKTRLRASPVVIHNLACNFLVQPVTPERVYEVFKSSKRFCLPSYEPELFPAVMVQERGQKRKACIFHSGKINITGCKSWSEATKMRHRISKRLRPLFKVQHELLDTRGEQDHSLLGVPLTGDPLTITHQ